jgi:cytochrome b561
MGSMKPAYTGTAKSLHWLILALLIVQFVLAWTMPHIGRNTPLAALINLHFSFGVLILFVALIRVIWRLAHTEPEPEDAIPPWQHQSAQVVHWLLYLFLFVVPILGWVNANWRGYPVTLFGLFEMPKIVTYTGFWRPTRCWRWLACMSLRPFTTTSSAVTACCNACCRGYDPSRPGWRPSPFPKLAQRLRPDIKQRFRTPSIPAVRAIAQAPQNVTRAVARRTFAPPALAPTAPRSARKPKDVADTIGTIAPMGDTTTISKGNAAPTENVKADVNAAWTGRAVVISEIPSSSRA